MSGEQAHFVGEMRINKFLSAIGYCSRREADRHIEAGEVRVGGALAGLGTVVRQGDIVSVGGVVALVSMCCAVHLDFGNGSVPTSILIAVGIGIAFDPDTAFSAGSSSPTRRAEPDSVARQNII